MCTIPHAASTHSLFTRYAIFFVCHPFFLVPTVFHFLSYIQAASCASTRLRGVNAGVKKKVTYPHFLSDLALRISLLSALAVEYLALFPWQR